MFEQWGFLLTEIWVLLALAALIGLIAGWLIFGGQKTTDGADATQQKARVATLEAELAACKASKSADVDMTPPEIVEIPVPADPNAIGKEPVTLDEPNGGQADNLKKIKGVGPKLERLCNMMGFWHFEQIANWTDEEVAWVDENLQGFKGRVSRDEWVPQAKILAEGGETEFSKGFDDEPSE